MKLENLERKKKRNRHQRMEFVRYWANYIRTHDDKDWSEQQKKLIDSLV